MVGFGVEGPDDGDGEEVYGAEDVEDFFADVFEHCGEEEDLWWGLVSLVISVCLGEGGFGGGEREERL